MKKTTYHIWDVLYPILLYYVISGIVFFALTMILGSKQEIYMIKQLISSGAAIPFLAALWKQESGFRELSDTCCRVAKEHDSGVDFCFAKRIFMQKSISYSVNSNLYGKRQESIGKRAGQIGLSCVTVGSFGMALNNFIAMTPLMQVSNGFQTANENFFAGTMIMEILASCVVVPIAEELLFRGVVQKRCTMMAGEKAGVLFSALLFGIIHVNLVQFLYAALIGLVLGAIVQKTGKVSLAVWGHAAANLIAIVRAETGVFDFSYQPDLAGIGFSVLLVCVGVAGGWFLWKSETLVLLREQQQIEKGSLL